MRGSSSDAPFSPVPAATSQIFCCSSGISPCWCRMAGNRRRNPRSPKILVLHLRRLSPSPRAPLSSIRSSSLPSSPAGAALIASVLNPIKLRPQIRCAPPNSSPISRKRHHLLRQQIHPCTGINSRCRCTTLHLAPLAESSRTARAHAPHAGRYIHASPPSFTARSNESRNCPSGRNRRQRNSASPRPSPSLWVPQFTPSRAGAPTRARSVLVGVAGRDDWVRRISSYPTAIPATSNPSLLADGATIPSLSFKTRHIPRLNHTLALRNHRIARLEHQPPPPPAAGLNINHQRLPRRRCRMQIALKKLAAGLACISAVRTMSPRTKSCHKRTHCRNPHLRLRRGCTFTSTLRQCIS